MTSILKGEGTRNCPYYVHGFRNQEFTAIKDGLKLCDEQGITRLNVAYSGRYYERREDGWYETSDTEVCDKAQGLPANGKKVK